MSDVAIRELCAGQYRVDTYNSAGQRMAYNPVYCSFMDISTYADNARNGKYCSRTYSAADNYNGAAGYFTQVATGRWAYGFSSWASSGSVITNLRYGDGRIGFHVPYLSLIHI